MLGDVVKEGIVGQSLVLELCGIWTTREVARKVIVLTPGDATVPGPHRSGALAVVTVLVQRQLKDSWSWRGSRVGPRSGRPQLGDCLAGPAFQSS